MRTASLVLFITGFLAMIVGCSNGAGVVSPDLRGNDQSINSSNRELWGIYDVYIDNETLEVTSVPLRNTQFRMNVNTFMNMNPSTLTFQITDSSKLNTTGELKLNVSLTHPVNKPKLAGFDVHCVLLSNSVAWLKMDNSLTYPVEGSNTVLLNPDGWTRWYNASEFTTAGLFGYTPGILGNIKNPDATLNAYKLYADGLGISADVATWLEANQSKRAIFSPGSKNTREWIMKFPIIGGKPQLKFQYSVVASWAKPSKDNPTPADFPPDANIQEAAHLRVDTSASTLYYTPTKWGGNLVVKVDIFDWQGGSNIQAQVSKVIIESNCLNNPFTDSAPVLVQNTGSPYATYSATIPAQVLSSANPLDVWIAVASASPTNYDNGVGSVYPIGKPLLAFTKSKVQVSNEAPIEPPKLISGVDIVSGTTRCPDRSKDNAAVFEVKVESALQLTYSWNIEIVKSQGEKVPGYINNPGDGKGKLSVNFTSSVFKNIQTILKITCSITDGVNPPISANPLEVTLDCIFFNADLNGYSNPDNLGWKITDTGGMAMNWLTNMATHPTGAIPGMGALWIVDPDFGVGILPNSKGLLLSPPINLPAYLSSARIEIDHAYGFSPFSMGGNFKLGQVGTLTSVGNPFKSITSGHNYDGSISDSSNAMYPQPVFSALASQNIYTSILTVQPALIGVSINIGFAAASGATGYADGGWLIDNVKVIGIL